MTSNLFLKIKMLVDCETLLRNYNESKFTVIFITFIVILFMYLIFFRTIYATLSPIQESNKVRFLIILISLTKIWVELVLSSTSLTISRAD
jgi:hypothetical protein